MCAIAPTTAAEVAIALELMTELRGTLRERSAEDVSLTLPLATTAFGVARLDAQFALPLWNFCTGFNGVFDATISH